MLCVPLTLFLFCCLSLSLYLFLYCCLSLSLSLSLFLYCCLSLSHCPSISTSVCFIFLFPSTQARRIIIWISRLVFVILKKRIKALYPTKIIYWGKMFCFICLTCSHWNNKFLFTIHNQSKLSYWCFVTFFGPYEGNSGIFQPFFANSIWTSRVSWRHLPKCPAWSLVYTKLCYSIWYTWWCRKIIWSVFHRKRLSGSIFSDRTLRLWLKCQNLWHLMSFN